MTEQDGQSVAQVPTTTPAPVTRCRVRVFVDFWNYELSMHDHEREFRTDWKMVGQVLAVETARIINPLAHPEYQGLNVYASYDPRTEAGERHRRWSTNVLNRFPGVGVSIVPNQRKATGPRCPSCHDIVARCPKCESDMRGNEEKSVDVRIATDLIRLAWADNYDAALLISSDRDFIPVVEFLETKAIKIIHGSFPPKSAELSQKCWASIDIPAIKHLFCRK